jgi:hypothetical protein
MFLLSLVTRRMEIAAESGLETTLSGNLMVANRPQQHRSRHRNGRLDPV